MKQSMHYVLDARTAAPHFPGIGRYVNSLAGALPAELDEGESLSLLHSPGSRFSVPPGSGSLAASASPFSISQQRQIPRLLKQTGADLYHSPYYLMPYRPGMPAVLTVYDLIPLLIPQSVSVRARLLFRLASRLALGASTQIIAISNTTRAGVISYFYLPPERITVIPLAASSRFYPQPQSEIERVRGKLSLPESYILYVGINKPHKNLMRLMEAWKMLQDGLQGETALVVAGVWDERYAEPKVYARQTGLDRRTIFLGPVDEADLPGLYGGATLFVFPSLYEGFGLPVLEALACGTPAACSGASSLPEVAGEAALYFEPTGTAAISSAVRRLLEDENLRRKLSRKGIEQAARFSWQHTARETLAVYRRVLGV